jgi:hypothetical protein
MDSWKESKNNRYKKPKYKGHNYNCHYNNHSNNFSYHNNKKHFKDYKKYKSPYNYSSSFNNYLNNKSNSKHKYIEKEIELNGSGKPENGDESPEGNILYNSLDSNSKNNLDSNSQENTDDNTNSLDYLNLELLKSQSEDLSNKNNFNFHEIGRKLFPGAFRYNKKKNNEKNIFDGVTNSHNNLSEEDKKIDANCENYQNNNNLKCKNYLSKENCNCKKGEQKKGLALAIDYYSSFLEDKIKE